MGCLRGVTVLLDWSLILVAALTLLVPSASAQVCHDWFHSTSGTINGFDDTVELEATVAETTPPDTELYTLSWDECVDPPEISDETFNTYFTVNDTVDCEWVVSVKTDLIGVPDYPLLQNTIETVVTFDGFTNTSFESCILTLRHRITDENTQTPEPEQATYTLDIKEDLNTGYTIAEFNTSVQDKDGSSPNNQFSVTVDDNCPLEATRLIYTSGSEPRPVEYQLREEVNYEVTQTITCTVTFQDNGSTPLSDSTTITINVIDVNDEPPVFDEEYYYSEVSSVVAPGDPLVISPSEITATDGDTGISAAISYTMTNANPDVNGLDYFDIKGNTGEVTLKQDLDEDFLLNERVLFLVKASDGSLTASVILEIKLPPVPTTIASTTPTTTCEPCTCPTYTTELVTECPTTPTEDTCTPCPTTDTTTELVCPSTPTEGTCTPCPTETTMACTCPEITCPTTPTEGTCTPCPTETTMACTCPEITCPTTPTEGTCTPCPTETTMACTCPEITCPTTPTEGTSSPCPTETTTDNACPEITCPTTPTECTCPTTETTIETVSTTTPSEDTCAPCPTETTTECNCPEVTCPTCPSEGPTTTTATRPTVTWDPDLPPLTFKKESYVADIYSSFTTLFAVEVEDVEGYEVTYSLRGSGSQYFSIDANTGMISVNQDNLPPMALYEMEAQATVTSVPSEQATTKVTINVLPLSSGEVVILTSIITASVPEGEGQQDLGSVTLSDTADIVCVTGAEPSNLKDRFTLDKESEESWKLKKSGALDYETTKEIRLFIRAYVGQSPENCGSINEEIPDEFLKSEALAIITVTDTNDVAPEFSSDDLVAAHPTNEGLKRVVGPVVSVHAIDDDTTDVRYSLTGQDAAQFTVDEVTGDVYGVEGLNCDPNCVFGVKASDEVNEDEVNVTVLPLDTGHVFTILMPNTALSEVDEKLEQLSENAGVQISMLYVSPSTETTARRWRTRYRRDTTTSLTVHVYSIKDGALMSRDELNSALSDGSSELQAEEFIDVGVFESDDPVDTTGLKVAVGVLGALLGIVLVAGVAFFVFQKRKGKAAPRHGKPPTPISTLGQAYHNPSYTAENSPSQVNLGSGSVGHKSNGSLNGYTGGGSLNGYTSAEVHRHPDQDSPPLHRSPLARPTDSIPLRTRDSPQQGGLKRTSPGAPEYYGSSSPAPPPSFSSTSSPSYPIYAEIKKPRDPSTSADKKSQHYSDDEDDLGDAKFSSVRRSPAPRRSIKPDNDDDDEDGDVAYPGGRHAGFKEESAEEEKKSVAFKVKVETKEIEAENMGPAQKKAEATKLMEANRKKLQEEGDDEDEDEEEEESMKL